MTFTASRSTRSCRLLILREKLLASVKSSPKMSSACRPVDHSSSYLQEVVELGSSFLGHKLNFDQGLNAHMVQLLLTSVLNQTKYSEPGFLFSCSS